MRYVAFCSLLLVAGCMRSVWTANYEPISEQRFEHTDGRTIKFEEVDYATLQNSRDLPGYMTLGVCAFRDKVLDVPPGSRDSSLREQAAKSGADYVRWAARPLTTVSQGLAYGGTAYSGTHEVFDYYAVLYRKQPGQ